jgi:hypothetical protein
VKRREPMKRTPLKRKTGIKATPAARMTARTRAKKQTRKYDPAEKPAREAVYSRSGGNCEIRLRGVCTGQGQEWHHRKNRSQGGPWSASNGLHACRKCHAAVTDTRPEYKAAGWCVEQWQVPAEVPVLIPFGWVLLDDHGCFTPSLPFEEGAA